MTIRKTPSRTLGILGFLSGAIAIFLLVFPYYYLGQDAYIPKKNPIMGYFLPKSFEAWIFLLSSLSLLACSIVALTIFAIGKHKSKERFRPQKKM